MNPLLAELQAKQKARATSVIQPPPQPVASTTSSSSTTATAPTSSHVTPPTPSHPPPLPPPTRPSSASVSVTGSTPPPPPPRNLPPPPPRAGSTIVTGGGAGPPPLPPTTPQTQTTTSNAVPPLPTHSAPPPPLPVAAVSNVTPSPVPSTPPTTTAGPRIPPPLPPGPRVIPPPPPTPSSGHPGVPGPPPPRPPTHAIVAALSPHSRLPPPLPPPLATPSIIVPGTAGDFNDGEVGEAPDTPTSTIGGGGGQHRSTRSLSAPIPPQNLFSPTINPLSPPPSTLPLPVLPAFPSPTHGGTGSEQDSTNSQMTTYKRHIPDNRPIYMNDATEVHLDDDDEDVDALAGHAPSVEYRLLMPHAIKLSETVRVWNEVPENRFVDDFVPAIPSNADSLVLASLTALQRPIKTFVRTHVKYHKVPNPNSSNPTGSTKLRDREPVQFEVDETWNQPNSTTTNAATSSSSTSSTTSTTSSGGTIMSTPASKRRSGQPGGLADLFNQPASVTNSPNPSSSNTNDATAPNTPSTTTSSIATAASAAAAAEAESQRLASEIEVLSHLPLLKVTPEEAHHAAVTATQDTFAKTPENLFLRSSPDYVFREAHQAEFSIGKRQPPSQATNMWSRDSVGAAGGRTQLLVSPAVLKLGVGNIEPFFGSLALYDLKIGIKLSEDFHFDLNDNSLLTGQLEVNKSCADAITLCNHALFQITDRHSDIVLVVKFERILQGDPAEMTEIYTAKVKQRPLAEIQALVKKTRNNLIYLSDYRQTFGWGFLNLFEESGELKNPSGGSDRGPNITRIDRIFQQIDSLKDDAFIQMLKEVRQEAAGTTDSSVASAASAAANLLVSSKGKIYPGTYFDLRLEELSSDCLPINRVDVSCIALKNTEQLYEVKEVAEYNVASDCPLPTGPGSGGKPIITVPSTPMSTMTPSTPSTPSVPATPSMTGHTLTPHHSSSGSISGLPSGLASAASVASHTTPFSNNPIPSPPIIREIEEFSSYSPHLANTVGAPSPHTCFINLMYLYPEFIKFEKFRNIACRIQFRNSDSNVVLEGMQVIRGKSSGSNFVLSSLTQVNYHRKQVTPQDEVKIMLPLTLTASTHLFFTFYKVSCKTKPGKREIIGYAVLPVYVKNRIIGDAVYELPIAAKLPKNYLQPYSDGKETDELHFRHNGLKCFNIRVRLLSSIFSQDEHIYSFLHTFPNSKELIAAGPHHGKDLLHKAVDHIHKIHPWFTIKFLPPLLDYLFELIQNRATISLPSNQNNANQIQASYFGFLGLTYLIFKISEYYNAHYNERDASGQGGAGSNRCAILVAYITHRLENLSTPLIVPGTSTTQPTTDGATPSTTASGATYVPIYSIFTKLWLAGLSPGATGENAALFTLPSASSSAAASAAASLLSAAIASPPLVNATPSSSGATASKDSTHQSLHERLLISYAWFYFEVIYKSLVLERDRQKSEGGFKDDVHLKEFLSNFEKLLDVIISIVYKHRTVGLTSVKHLVHNLALFFNDLFSVLEKDRVLGFLNKFLLAFRVGMNYSDPVLIEIKFSFYTILLDFEWFMDVCEVEAIPAEVAATPSASDDADDDDSGHHGKNENSAELLNRIRKKYPLIALFITDYVHNLARAREIVIREKIITTLRNFLTKYDYDARWQKVKPEIATMFLPLLLAHLDELDGMLRRKTGEGDSSSDYEPSTTVTSQISSHKATSTSSSSAPPSSPTSTPNTNASGEEGKLRRNILVCILWVLKNVPITLLKTWWKRDLLTHSALTAANASNSSTSGSGSRESSVSERGSALDQAHTEGPLIDFVYLLETCLTSFPYHGVHRRETELLDADCILAPETLALYQGMDGSASGLGGVADIKNDIEALMLNIHKTRTLGGGGGTLRAARAAAAGGTISGDKTISGTISSSGAGVGGKSNLRQLRAQLQQKNATMGPGGLAAMQQSMGMPDPMGTIGRGASTANLNGTMNPNGTVNTQFLLAATAGMTSTSTGTFRGKTMKGGEPASKDYLKKLTQWEGYLIRNIAQVVIRLLHEFLEDFHTFISVTHNWLQSKEDILENCADSFQCILKIFISFVSGNHANSTLLSLFPTMLLFVQRYGRFFHINSSLKKTMGAFTSMAFRICAFSDVHVRQHAIALIYSLLINNYDLDKNLFHLQMHLTISLSKLTENLSVTSEKFLQASIQALMKLAAKSAASGGDHGGDFKTKLDTLLGRLSTILSDSMEISRQTKLGVDADSATSENLLVQIADAFSHIPEIRIEWLNRLAHHHQREDQYAEAGQCWSEDHQIMTECGFMSLDQLLDLQRADQLPLIAAFNQATQQIEYRALSHKILVKSGVHRMIDIQDEHDPAAVSLSVTADHEMYVRSNSIKKFTKMKASELMHSNSVQFLASASNGVLPSYQSRIQLEQLKSDLNLSNENQLQTFFELVGFSLGETKTNVDHQSYLTQLFCQLPLVPDVDYHLHGSTFSITHPTWQQYFTKEFRVIFNFLSKSHSRSLLQGFMAAATSINDTIYTSSIELRDQVMLICLHAGYSAVFEPVAFEAGWLISFSESSETTEPTINCAQQITQRIYHGRVWCVTVPPHHLVIVRRALESANSLPPHITRASRPVVIGQCYIQMANLVMSKGSGDSGDGYSMVDNKTPQELDKLVSMYYELACKMLDKAELYEQCSEVYKLLQPIYHKYRDYKSLSISHYHLHQVFEKLMEANRKQSRMLGTYYRIGFYGLKFGPRLHGNEFIYKLPKITRLSEVATRMKTLYSNQLGCSVKVLPDSNPVDISKLDNIAEECWLQITFVSPAFTPEGTPPTEFEQSIDLLPKPRNTWIEQNTGLQAFKFSTPFTAGGKTYGSVTDQHKRNTILYARAEFPYILTAQSVVKRVETILSPIASATEDVILRTNSLLELISSDSLNTKVLTGLLAGSVATQVHGGSKEICQAFLSEEDSNDKHSSGSADLGSPITSPLTSPVAGGVKVSFADDAIASNTTSITAASTSRWSVQDQEKLKEAMRAFLAACQAGLETNKRLAEKGGSDAEKEFQANLEQQYQELLTVINPLLRERKSRKPKSAKKGVRFG